MREVSGDVAQIRNAFDNRSHAVVRCFGRRQEKEPQRRPRGDRPSRGGPGPVNFYSLEKEIALGKQLAQEVERQAKIIDDPIIAEYVNRVGQNLVRNSDAKVPSPSRCWIPKR